MGENPAAEGRMAVRTPMQWTSGPNGGFSHAPKRKLTAAVVEGSFSPDFVNVNDQRNDPGSMLAFMRMLIKRYRECPELGWGSFTVLDQPHASVLAHVSNWDDGTLLSMHNLSADGISVPITLDGCDQTHRLVDLLDVGETRLDASGRAELTLEGYGYRWLRLVAEGSRRLL